MIRAAVLGLAVGIMAVVAASGRASLYQPHDSMTLAVDDKGVPEALPFDEFSRRRLILRNIGNPNWPLEVPDPVTKQPVIDPKTGKPRLTERGVVEQRVHEAKKKPNRTAEENVALAVDLLRLGRPTDAAGVLANQRWGFLSNVTLAHIAIAQDSLDHPTWGEAFTYLDIANEERPPKELPGWSPQQLAWQLKLNRGPFLKLVNLRLAEVRLAKAKARGPRVPPENELPDRIFDMNFVNAAGVYEPGVLAPAERAKLPPDALATIQQFVLWFPNDTRLYWLLAELYAAKGEFAAAKRIMDESVDSGHYSNRKALMQHREAVTKAAKAQGSAAPDEPLLAPAGPAPPPEPGPPPPATPVSMLTVGIYFGAVAAIALFALVRAMMKKRKSGTGGPIG